MPQPETKYHIDSNESHKFRRTLKRKCSSTNNNITFLIRVLSFIRHFSSAFYLSSAISHPRFIFHLPFSHPPSVSAVRIRRPYPPSVSAFYPYPLHFSSAFYLSSAISHPRFIFHPPFLIRHPYPPSVSAIRIRILSLPQKKSLYIVQ